MKVNDEYYTLRRQVNRAIIKTLKEAGVTFPYQKGQMNVQTNLPPSKNNATQESDSWKGFIFHKSKLNLIACIEVTFLPRMASGKLNLQLF